MAFLDELRAPLHWRDALTARNALLFGAVTLGVSFCFAGLVALLLSEPAPLRPSALSRQGYGPAWILNSGFAIWGGIVFCLGLTMQGQRRGASKLGVLLIGAGFFALSLWSAAPLPGEPLGSLIETRLHGLYVLMLCVGFGLACGSQALRELHNGAVDLPSVGTFCGALVLILGAAIQPGLTAVAETGVMGLVCLWCLLRIETLRGQV